MFRRWAQKTGLGLAVVAALITAACGGSSPPTAEPTPVATEAPTSAQPASDSTPIPEAVESHLPAVEVINLDTGNSVNLASFAPSDRPIVLWFWAPH